MKTGDGLSWASSVDLIYEAINVMALDLAGQLNGAEVGLMDEMNRPIANLGEDQRSA